MRVISIVIAACALCQPSLRGAEPFLDKTDLFTAKQAGYETFRIPGVVVTKSGTVLAYCEARRGSRSDWADIEILLTRSTNGGRTWSPPQRVADSGKDTVNNAVAIVDRESGRIHFLYCINYHTVYYMFSDDDAVTFSKPREITSDLETLRKHYNWKVIATGPGHGLQLRNGRLLVPIWMSTELKHHRPSAVSVIYSDDHGKTWMTGDIVCEHPDPLINPSETIAAQLSDDRVLLNIRSEHRNYRRALSISDDGVTNWSVIKFDEGLFEPICMAAIAQLPKPFATNDGTFIFSNPDSSSNPAFHGKNRFRHRENVTIRLSTDDCQTWPVSRVLQPGISGYSDLAVATDGTIYCLYERGGDDGFAHKHLTMARFNREWIEAKQ
ncbi:sialidase family protein [Rhodopirellula bahusiensis]|uniref:exo-alpha-sialidase n=1 Tax=Rhodopirellula bahusiensis TaxID=2014065 RepID=A0A2G1WD67_9BACT|nr:sialidase family protein [Rhodopirellula bahusiensis]PHQ37004.1 exo-alpha-sialidase [Rhodopirellula bahusiensis]